MNNEARVANALAMSGPGMSEADYWNAPARTTDDQYADVYGGTSIQTAGKFHGADSLMRQQELARIASQAWDPSYYTSNENIKIEIHGVAPAADILYGNGSSTGMPDNARCAIGQSQVCAWNAGQRSRQIDLRSSALREN